MQLDLRRVSANDEAFLVELYSDVRSEELDAMNLDPSQRETFLRQQFVAQATGYESRYGNEGHCVVELDGEAIGRIWVARSAEEIHLVDIAILRAYRARGIGTQLLGQLLREGQERGLPVRQYVLKSNERALRLYERVGFRVVREGRACTF